jgi:hypothetical protein
MSGTPDHLQALIDRRPRIEALSTTAGWVMFEGGVVLQFLGYIDEDGERTPYYSEASHYLVGTERRPWNFLVPVEAYNMPSYKDH